MTTRTRRLGLATAALASVFLLTACNDDDDDNGNSTAAETGVETSAEQSSPAAAAQAEEALTFTFEGITVTRPNGNSFEVTAIASCGYISDEFNLAREDDLAAYESACRERVRKRLEYTSCDRNSFMTSIATNNPEIRLRGLAHLGDYDGVDDIHEGLLWQEDQVARAGASGMDSYTVTHISDLDAADRYEGFVQAEDCGDRIFRGGQPKP